MVAELETVAWQDARSMGPCDASARSMGPSLGLRLWLGKMHEIVELEAGLAGCAEHVVFKCEMFTRILVSSSLFEASSSTCKAQQWRL